MPFRNLSMNEFPMRTRIARLHITPRSTPALEPPVLTCNVVVPTTLTVLLVAFFEGGRLSGCIALRHSVLRRFFSHNVWCCT